LIGLASAWLGSLALLVSLAACGTDSRQGVREALGEYVAACEARDPERLQAVWGISQTERAFVRTLLDHSDRVSLKIDTREMVVADDSATVEFDQTLEFSGPAGEGYDRSRLKASLIRRARGDWMIIDIARRDAGEDPAPPGSPLGVEIASARRSEAPVQVGAGLPSERIRGASMPVKRDREVPARPSIGESLREYRDAFETRDLDRLGRVWRMSAVERLLIQRAWEACGDITLELEMGDARADGEEASVFFDQKLVLDCAERQAETHSRVRASLERDRDGRWVIVDLSPRETELNGATRLDPRDPRDERPDRTAVLTALDEYREALRDCDLTELSRVWIMNALERQILEGVCHEYESLSVAIRSPRVAMAEDRARIDFTQSVAYPGTRGLRHTQSDLTALMVRRAGGEWAIWKIQGAD
jgi:uncharacterized protein YchJ